MLEQTNDIRADRIANNFGQYDEDEPQDMLSDFMHWCDREGHDFGEVLGTARMHYNDEIDADDDISPGERLGDEHDDKPVGEIVIDDSVGDGDFIGIDIPGLSGLKLVVRRYISNELAKNNEKFDGTVAPRDKHDVAYILTDVTLGGHGRYRRYKRD